MSTVEIALNVRLFQAAEIDLEAGKILTQQNRCQPAIYHFQQAYEKCIKAYYSLKEIIDNHTPESEIYRKLINLRHDTQRSTIQLLHDIADIQKHAAEEAIVKIQEIQAENPLHNEIHPRAVPLYQQLISMANGIHTALDNLVASLNLEVNYINNVRNYAEKVKEYYNIFQSSVNELIVKQPYETLLIIIASVRALYPGLYTMEQIARYTLPEFAYENLALLANQRQACDQIAEMLGDLFTVLKPYLSQPIPVTDSTP
ncbi:MAG: HEPN domain-containing protein [Nitrososphaeraceae archaeon]